MTEASWLALQQRLLMRYEMFKKRLTRQLGSADLASDALQDTWLRLERGGDLTQVQSPDNYLYTMAVNLAHDHRRLESRRLTTTEVETLLEIPDEAPDAARTVEARSDLDTLVAIIAELPVRQQAILVAARVEGLSRRDIADRFGVSVRFVQRELQEAQDFCAGRLEKINGGGFTSGSREPSTNRRPGATAFAKAARPRAVDE